MLRLLLEVNRTNVEQRLSGSTSERCPLSIILIMRMEGKVNAESTLTINLNRLHSRVVRTEQEHLENLAPPVNLNT